MISYPLPLFTFIVGPDDSDKKGLAELLCKQDASLTRISLQEPSRLALMGAYYSDALLDLSYDLRGTSVLDLPLPFPRVGGPEIKNRTWLAEFSYFLEQMHGPGILSHLAEREWQSQTFYYKRAIIEDACRKAHFEAFIPKGPQNILIVHVSKNGEDWFPFGGEDLFGVPGKHFACKGSASTMCVSLGQFLTGQKIDPTPVTGATLDNL